MNSAVIKPAMASIRAKKILQKRYTYTKSIKSTAKISKYYNL